VMILQDMVKHLIHNGSGLYVRSWNFADRRSKRLYSMASKLDLCSSLDGSDGHLTSVRSFYLRDIIWELQNIISFGMSYNRGPIGRVIC
jgi:hypothetical protein